MKLNPDTHCACGQHMDPHERDASILVCAHWRSPISAAMCCDAVSMDADE